MRARAALRRILIGAAATILAASTLTVASVGTAAHAASDDARLQGAEQILSLIPASARGVCFQVLPQDLNANLAGATAAVNCAPGVDGVDSVAYFLMNNGATLNVAYAEYLAQADGPSPDESACPTQTTWSYSDGTEGGAKACGDLSTDTQLVWTGTNPPIIGFAVSLQHDAAALAKWWTTDSAPLQKPDAVKFAPTTVAARRAAAKKLLPQTGKSTGCKQSDADISKVAAGSLLWQFLPWVSAALVCKAPANQGPIEYFQASPEAAQKFAARLEEHTVGQTTATKSSKECDQTRDLISKTTNKVDGQLGCFYVGGLLWAYWYHDNPKGTAPGLVGAMPGDHFTTPKKFYAYLFANQLL